MAEKSGVLLVNLGTPDTPDVPDVRRYLREFLSDPRVIDIHPFTRWALLNLIILPRRPKRSAEAYRKIWTSEGSPLLVHSRALSRAVQERIDVPVELAMRYGNPSLASGIEALKKAGCDHIVVFPLYPQYASSTTGSTLEAIYTLLAQEQNVVPLTVIPPFFNDPRFIDAWAAVAAPILEDSTPEHVVMSFHGLPERHLRKADHSENHCLRAPDCCQALSEVNQHCYRAQCYATARALAARLGLSGDDHSVSFQSRLGRDPWIQPYTDSLLTQLTERGIKNIAVLCPAFVADCLETLEEIGIAACESVAAAGGRLTLVPSLNDHPDWTDAAATMIRDRL